MPGGRRQLDGLRFHKGKGQWYRQYDCKERYFGPRGLSKEDAEAKRMAEREWHLWEMDLLPRIPRLTVEEATQELLDIGVDEAQIDAEVIGAWRRLSMVGDPMDQRAFLQNLLGINSHLVDEDPTIWGRLRTGARINPDHPRAEYLSARMYKIQAEDDAPTVTQVADHYLKFLDRHRSPTSYADASQILPHFLEFVGSGMRLSDLTKAHFVAYRDLLWDQIRQREEWEGQQGRRLSPRDKRGGPGMSPDYANRHIRLVKAAFHRYDKDEGLSAFGINDCLNSLEQKGGGRVVDIPIITPAELKLMLESLSPKYGMITLLALNMAGSNEDMNSATWSMIRWDHKYIDFERGKNRGPRRIPLWKVTLKQLRAWKKISPHPDLLFVNAHGGQLITYSRNDKGQSYKTDNLSIGFSAQMKRLNMPHTFRSIRKSTATVAKRFTDKGTVEMILGDAGQEVWRKYAMAIPELVADAIRSVGRYYGLR